MTFSALVAHPWVGSLWLEDVRLQDGYVVGTATYTHPVGGAPYIEEELQNWPLSCVRRFERRGADG